MKRPPEGSQKWPNPCKYHAKRARSKTTKKTPKSTPSGAKGSQKRPKMALQNLISSFRTHQGVQSAALCRAGSSQELILHGIYLHGFLNITKNQQKSTIEQDKSAEITTLADPSKTL